MTEFTLPHGDFLISPEHQPWVEQALTHLSSSTFAQEFNQKVNSAKAESDSTDFWTELGWASDWLRPYRVEDGVLTIPVKGMMLKNFPYALGSWATGYEYIREAILRGAADENIHTINLDIDSPGGMVAGCFDCADAIFEARGTKPINAYANESAYSAAYAIASAADSITVARTGGVGSIGVITMHVDISGMYENAGIKVTPIYAGNHKADGNPYEPLPDDVKTRIQERIDALYTLFVSTVARNRDLSEQSVRDTEAATFMAQEAVENGLADAVGPLGSLSASADHSNDDEDDNMSKDNQSVALADHEQAVADATAAGTETGKAEGATAERERINAILGSEEAKTRPAAAKHVALNSEMTVEAAQAFLAGLPEEKSEVPDGKGKSSFQNAMDNGDHPNVGDEANGGDDDDAEFLATFRASRGRA